MNYFERLADAPGPARFIIQPLVSIFFGIRDGINDVKSGTPPYIYLMIFDKGKRREAFSEGFKHILKIYIIAVILDSMVQYLVLEYWRLQVALVMGFLIVFLPYVIARALTNRIIIHRQKNRNNKEETGGKQFESE
jgi:hypothetical protein